MTRVTRWVPHVKHEMLTLPDHMNSPPVSSGVRDARSLVYCLMFCRSLLCPFVHFFSTIGIVCPSIFGFWLLLWFLHLSWGSSTKIDKQYQWKIELTINRITKIEQHKQQQQKEIWYRKCSESQHPVSHNWMTSRISLLHGTEHLTQYDGHKLPLIQKSNGLKQNKTNITYIRKITKHGNIRFINSLFCHRSIACLPSSTCVHC